MLAYRLRKETTLFCKRLLQLPHTQNPGPAAVRRDAKPAPRDNPASCAGGRKLWSSKTVKLKTQIRASKLVSLRITRAAYKPTGSKIAILALR